MLNEIKEFELYEYIPNNMDDRKKISKYANILKRDSLIPKLGGIRRAMTVIARGTMYSDNNSDYTPSEKDLSSALSALEKWCKYPSSKIDSAISDIASLEAIDLNNLTEDNINSIKKARESFNDLGYFKDEKSKDGGQKYKELVYNYDILIKAENACKSVSHKKTKDDINSTVDLRKAVKDYFGSTNNDEVHLSDLVTFLNLKEIIYSQNELEETVTELIEDSVIIGWKARQIIENSNSDNNKTETVWKKKKTNYLSKFNYDELAREKDKTESNDNYEGNLYQIINTMFSNWISENQFFNKKVTKPLYEYPDKLTENERIDALYRFWDNYSAKALDKELGVGTSAIQSFENCLLDFLQAKSRLRKGSIYDFKAFNLNNYLNDANKISYEKILADAFHCGPLNEYYLIADSNWEEQLKKRSTLENLLKNERTVKRINHIQNHREYKDINTDYGDKCLKIIATYLLNKQTNYSDDNAWVVANKQEIGNWFTGDSGENSVYNTFSKIVYNNSDFKSPLQWIVLEKKDGILTLLNLNAIECSTLESAQNGDKEGKIIKKKESIWEKSYFQTNLTQKYIINDMFSPEEQSQIQTTKIPNSKNKDKDYTLYLLNEEELNNYLKNDTLKNLINNFQITNYLSSKLKAFNEECSNYWMLRFTEKAYNFPCADRDGNIIKKSTTEDVCLIRYAVRIKLSDNKQLTTDKNEPISYDDIKIGSIITFGKYYKDCNYEREQVFQSVNVGKNAAKIHISDSVINKFTIKPASIVEEDLRKVLENEGTQVEQEKIIEQYKGKTIFKDTCYSAFINNDNSLDIVNPSSSLVSEIKNHKISTFNKLDGEYVKFDEKKSKYEVKIKNGKEKANIYFSCNKLCSNEYCMSGYRIQIDNTELKAENEGMESQKEQGFYQTLAKALKNTTDTTFKTIYEIDENGNIIKTPQIDSPQDFIFGLDK